MKMMREGKWLFAAVLAVTLSFVVIWFELSRLNPAEDNHAVSTPRLLIPSTFMLDIGDISQGHATGKIELHNSSEKTVEIIYVVKTCRCAEVHVPSKILQPGDKTTLKILWNTTGLRGKSRSDFTIFHRHTGEEESERLDLSIYGNVVPEFDIEPKQLVFNDKKRSRQIVRLVPRSTDCRAVITGMESDYSAFHFEKTSDSGVVITFEPSEWFTDKSLKSKNIRIKFNIDSHKEPSFVMTVNVVSEELR
jgi:hypothetical protein